MDMLDDLGRHYAWLVSVEEMRLRKLQPEQKAALYILRSLEIILASADGGRTSLDRHLQLTGELMEAMRETIAAGQDFKTALLSRDIRITAQRILDLKVQ
jgi:hypothetical protein